MFGSGWDGLWWVRCVLEWEFFNMVRVWKGCRGLFVGVLEQLVL